MPISMRMCLEPGAGRNQVLGRQSRCCSLQHLDIPVDFLWRIRIADVVFAVSVAAGVDEGLAVLVGDDKEWEAWLDRHGAALVLFVGSVRASAVENWLIGMFAVALLCTVGSLVTFMGDSLLAWHGLRRDGPLPRSIGQSTTD